MLVYTRIQGKAGEKLLRLGVTAHCEYFLYDTPILPYGFAMSYSKKYCSVQPKEDTYEKIHIWYLKVS